MINSKEIYDAVLVSAGVVGLSMAGQKFVKMGLGVDVSLKGVAKLTGGIIVSTYVVSWLQEQKYIPIDSFKKETVGPR